MHSIMILSDLEEAHIIGKSPAVEEKRAFINKIANCHKSVLILGETGTGKDLMARTIHDRSHRKSAPFVAVNCTHFPDELFESELFGYVQGAFTGAARNKPGLLESAKSGTVFLDEIGDLPFHLQTKLLRIVEQKEFRRIGETGMRKIQARFIFATNTYLPEEVRRGKFRKDLYFRISVLKFFIPPLRERKEDIPLLVDHFLHRENGKWHTNKEITFNAIKKLKTYDFPGNIRELQNILERAFLLSENDRIDEEAIQFEREISILREPSGRVADALRETLENCRWNKTKAALEIGKSRRHFYRLLEKYHMSDCIRKNY
ncbi:MAG: sigma-54 dependent transcriptional regulator [Candidatus Aminicenantales bacterium]